jgi:hypothetical protein
VTLRHTGPAATFPDRSAVGELLDLYLDAIARQRG